MVRIFERYLQDIGRQPLLSAEEEVQLAARARAGDGEARRRLATANLRFVVSMARRYQGNGLPLSDLVNEGNIGLLRAAERFDETRGVRFVSYAHWWIRRAIVDAIDRHLGGPNRDRDSPELSLDDPLTGDGAGTLQDVVPDGRVVGQDRRLVDEALRSALEASLADLPPREADVLRRYFGLGAAPPEDLGQIGRSLGVSRERARQVKERGLARLRVHAGRHDLRAFRGLANRRFGRAPRGQTAD
ncbi:MAG: RNA polymerase sigma factor RpoD/SigA [Gemmatimonadota bacterium]|nr:RNA polymerase sigma factor RpoD/SigA [Gemmatimonadota bacterium]